MDERDEPFVLAVDDLGCFLVTAGDELVVGHPRGGEADLPVLADVGPRHATLRRESSFRDGTTWRVAPSHGERVSVNGEPLGPHGRRLADGDQVRLAVNLELRFRRPDPASTTAVVALLRGAECRGCTGVLLFGRGPEGLVTVGRGPHAHLAAPALERELALELAGGELRMRALDLREGEAEPRPVAVPPCERVDLLFPRGGDDPRPFAIAVRPAPPPAPKGWRPALG